MTFQTQRIQFISDSYYREQFFSAVSVTILATQHKFTRVPSVKVYDNPSGGNEINPEILINFSNYDVTINFKQQRTGVIILT